MTAVETVGLGKRYGDTWALRDCTLSIPTGRVVALVGPNGAGKTTLLHCLVGLCSPTSGTAAVVDGLAAGDDDARDAVAFVAQQAPLLAHLRVDATVSLAETLNRSFDRPLAESRLAELKIPKKRRVARLSGGQQAQLALSIALARHPALLVLDEPLAPLDPLARHEFLAHLMAVVAEHGTSVLFSSHVVSDLDRVADYLVVLNEGTVQLAGDVDELLAAHDHWWGPVTGIDAARAMVPVVHEELAGRQARLLVRSDGAAPPAEWEADPVGVEELVLGCLRTPSARAVPGPRDVAASLTGGRP